ncbi:hypothetical protein CIT26_33465 [Mesorhizobium temperatum]|uniref:Uncharacterized protein n=1 Tax=Mesorhizobium temperatum TaxID=241416 RepID=A0A271L8X5_9HYPH|nr:hypothetical protein CIT26_33465 [Mesorhizobium temperatum]
MTDRSITSCDECGSTYFVESSAMTSLCAECAFHLYGYPACEHQFENGRRTGCGWDVSRSKSIADIISWESS